MSTLRTRSRNESGFTMGELLVVIVIIAILAGVVLAYFSSQRGRAADASVTSDVRNIATQVLTSQKKLNSTNVSSAPTYTELTASGVKASPNAVWGISSTADGEFCIIGYANNGKSYTSSESPQTYDSAAGGLGKKSAACSSGDTYVGSSVTVPATTYSVYSCPSGGNLSGTTCTVDARSYPATAYSAYTGTSRYCSWGDSQSGNTCYYNTTSRYDAPYYMGTCSYGSTTPFRIGECSTTYRQPTGYGYGCPNGDEQANGICYTYVGNRPNVYYCNSGYLDGRQCVVATQSSYSAYYQDNYETRYRCDNGGVRSDTTCNVASYPYVATDTKNYRCESNLRTYEAASRTCARSDA